MKISKMVNISDGFVMTTPPVELDCFKLAIQNMGDLIDKREIAGSVFLPLSKNESRYESMGEATHYLTKVIISDTRVEFIFELTTSIQGEMLDYLVMNTIGDKIVVLPGYDLHEKIVRNNQILGLRLGVISSVNLLIKRPFDTTAFYDEAMSKIFSETTNIF